MNRLTYVNGDGWCGLYLNGELVNEGHSIPPYVVGDVINNTSGGVQEFDTRHADLNWLDDVGNFPLHLTNVIFE